MKLDEVRELWLTWSVEEVLKMIRSSVQEQESPEAESSDAPSEDSETAFTLLSDLKLPSWAGVNMASFMANREK
jgi:hypothetical protein